MKIIDIYINKNFIKHFLYITIFIQIISVTFDILKNISIIEYNNITITYLLIHYYPYWIISNCNMFIPIYTFLSVIISAYKMENNLEISAMLSVSLSVKKLLKYYLRFPIIISISFFILNFFFIPYNNNKIKKFYYNHLTTEKKNNNNFDIKCKIGNNQYIFIKNFSRKNYFGKYFIYQIFENYNPIYILKSKYIIWDEKKKCYLLYNYCENNIVKYHDFYNKGYKKYINLSIHPKLLFQNDTQPESMNIISIIFFTMNNTNNRNINLYLNEIYKRINQPISTLFFSIIGIFFSIEIKRTNDIKNIIIIISIIFTYILSTEIIKILSSKNYISFNYIWILNILLFIYILHKKNNLFN